MSKKFEVEILNKIGSCDDKLFEKMAKKGDIVAERLTALVDAVVTIIGVATCKITTDDKEFELTYYATDEGYFTSGSEFFKESVLDYIDDCTTFKIKKIKTKKGFTFKAVPVLSKNNPKSLDREDNEDLPF